MDTRTVAALDVITVFAVPNLNNFLAKVVDFFRVWLPSELPRLAGHSAYFGPATLLEAGPFQPSTATIIRIRGRP